MIKVLQSAGTASVLFICTVANAKSPEPTFPTSIGLPSTEDKLYKIGEHRYIHKMFFKIYDVALYAEDGAQRKDILDAKASYQLQFRYLREVDKSIILKSSAKILRKNLVPEELDSITVRLNRLNTAYQTVGKGDRSSLTYQPGIGTTLHINDLPIITIEGEDFARHYFTIWLGKLPISKSLKEDLIKI